MEKHLEIFCSQNPTTDIPCPICGKDNYVKTKDLLKIKYTYNGICKACNEGYSYKTKAFYNSLEPLKKYT